MDNEENKTQDTGTDITELSGGAPAAPAEAVEEETWHVGSVNRSDAKHMLDVLRKVPGMTDRKAAAELTRLLGIKITVESEVCKKIKSFEGALAVLGKDNRYVRDYMLLKEASPRLAAYCKLLVISEALNEGREPDGKDGEQWCQPWFSVYDFENWKNVDDFTKETAAVQFVGEENPKYCGMTFAYVDKIPDQYLGAAIRLRNDTLAEYCGKQFIELWGTLLTGFPCKPPEVVKIEKKDNGKQ